MKKVLVTSAKIVLIFAFFALIGCSTKEKSQKRSSREEERMAQQLYARSLSTLEKGEYSPAISNLLHAEMLTRDEELKIRIADLKADIFTHVQVLTGIEERATLKYTLMYRKDEVYYPIENMHVVFSFVEGSGVINESSNTDANGTARGTVQKLTSPSSRFVVEAVPVVHIDKEVMRIDALKRDFTFSRRQTVEASRRERIIEIIRDRIGRFLEIEMMH